MKFFLLNNGICSKYLLIVIYLFSLNLIAEEITVNIGIYKEFASEAVLDFVSSMVKKKDLRFKTYFKNGLVQMPDSPEKYILEANNQFSFTIENDNINFISKVKFDETEYDLKYSKSVSSNPANIQLASKYDMTGCFSNRALNSLIVEEVASGKSAFFFEKAEIILEKEYIKGIFYPKAELPAFITGINNIADIKIGREFKIKGEAAELKPEIELGFDNGLLEKGFVIKENAASVPDYNAVFNSIQFIHRPGPNKMNIGSFSAEAEFKKKKKVLLSKNKIASRERMHINLESVRKEAAVSLGESIANKYISTILKDIFKIESNSKNLSLVNKGFLIQKEDVKGSDFCILYTLKPEGKKKNPYLKEFQAAVETRYPDKTNTEAYYKFVLELAPVYDQGKFEEKMYSARTYFIFTVYEKGRKVYSENLTVASISISMDAVNKDVTIRMGKLAADKISEFCEKNNCK